MAGALALVLLAGCTAGSDDDPAAPTSTSSTSPTSSAANPSVAPTSAPPVALPNTCAGLLPLTELDGALGTGLPGAVSYVRGQPIPDIGRTDRITCGFGVVTGEDGVAQPPLLEISLAAYSDPAAAADRVAVTTAGGQTAGDRVAAVNVADLPAVALTGVTSTTLVFAEQTLTYSLTLLRAVVPEEQTVDRLVAVAEAVRAAANG